MPVIVHIGEGFFIPWRGNVPTKNQAAAMQFQTNEEADQYARDNGWAQASYSRMTGTDRLNAQYSEGKGKEQ